MILLWRTSDACILNRHKDTIIGIGTRLGLIVQSIKNLVFQFLPSLMVFMTTAESGAGIGAGNKDQGKQQAAKQSSR